MTKMDLVLHIGIEKTGTTLLQSWLYANAEALSRQGVYLGQSLGTPNNRKLVAFFQTSRDDFWAFNGFATDDGKRQFFGGFLESVEEELRAAEADHHTMVITSEHFHSRLVNDAEVAELAAFCHRNFASTRVVCYLREQSAVRRSLYSTVLKTGGTVAFDDFQTELRPETPYYDFHGLAERWARHFGPESLDLRLYDSRSFAGGDLRRDFLTAIGRGVAPDGLDFAERAENVSVKLLKAHALIGLNRALPLFAGDRVDQRNARLKAVLLGLKSLDRGALRDRHAPRLHKAFRAANARLAEQFFGRSELFEPPAAPPEAEESIPVSEVAAIVENVVHEMVQTVGPRLLEEDDVNVLRDVALKYESGERLTRFQATKLMGLAARARPKGPVIRQKLRDWTEGRTPQTTGE